MALETTRNRERGASLENIVSNDGKIRKCKVKTSTGEMTRALKHIYPLEINVETFIDKIKEKSYMETMTLKGLMTLPPPETAKL